MFGSADKRVMTCAYSSKSNNGHDKPKNTTEKKCKGKQLSHENEYTLLRKKINLFILHIHPDRFLDRPSLHKINQRSLTELNGYLNDVDKQRRTETRRSAQKLTFYARMNPVNTDEITTVKASISGAQDGTSFVAANSLLRSLMEPVGLVAIKKSANANLARAGPTEREQMEGLFATHLPQHFKTRRRKLCVRESIIQAAHGRGNVMTIPSLPQDVETCPANIMDITKHDSTLDREYPTSGTHSVPSKNYNRSAAHDSGTEVSVALIRDFAQRGLLTFAPELTKNQKLEALRCLTRLLPDLEFSRWAHIPMVVSHKYARSIPGVLIVPFHITRDKFRQYFFKHVDDVISERLMKQE
eukprot:CFRG8317T1